MNNLLRKKPWQISFLMIIAPALSIIFGAILVKITGSEIWILMGAIGCAFFMCGTYFGWLWAAARYTYSHAILAKSFSVFKYLFLCSIFLAFLIIPILTHWLNEEYMLYLSLLNIIVFITFIFCIYRIAKNLTEIEKQKFNKNRNVLINSILIWLLPIGIWVIEPRIRELLFAEDE